jgi:hypothetical protein
MNREKGGKQEREAVLSRGALVGLEEVIGEI